MAANALRATVAALILGFAPLVTHPAGAQVYEPVILVNDRAITQYEIDQRALLLQAFGARGNLSALAREQLIDDRLRLFAAAQFDIELSPQDVQAGLQEFAQQRELTIEQVAGALAQRGIAQESLSDFIEAQLAWRNVVRGRFRARATPSEADLDAALEFQSSGIQQAVLLQEIALANEERGEDETQDLATRLSRELNRGGNFGSAVARYSRAPSARNGGRLPWIPARELPGPVAVQVLSLMPGEVSAPIPVPGGLTIIKLLDTREERVDPATSEQTITYSQLVIPLSANAPETAVAEATQRLEEIRASAELCTDIDARAGEFELGSGRSDPTPLAQVPGRLRDRLAVLDPGDIEVFRDGSGVTLVMLCARSGETSPEEREALRNRLFNQRIGAFAQGYLQELRGDAVIIEK